MGQLTQYSILDLNLPNAPARIKLAGEFRLTAPGNGISQRPEGLIQ